MPRLPRAPYGGGFPTPRSGAIRSHRLRKTATSGPSSAAGRQGSLKVHTGADHLTAAVRRPGPRCRGRCGPGDPRRPRARARRGPPATAGRRATPRRWGRRASPSARGAGALGGETIGIRRVAPGHDAQRQAAPIHELLRHLEELLLAGTGDLGRPPGDRRVGRPVGGGQVDEGPSDGPGGDELGPHLRHVGHVALGAPLEELADELVELGGPQHVRRDRTGEDRLPRGPAWRRCSPA